MEKNIRVCIIGLGLIGGSLAKALTATGSYTVTAYDINSAALQAALDCGCITGIADCNKKLDSDIVILALSADAAISFVSEHILQLSGCIVTDVCGIKSRIVAALEPLCAANGICYVGGHPMAGREKNGFENSVASLFENRYYILTKTANTDTTALERLTKTAYDIGCCGVTVTTPERHDEMIAFTSQLPHILAGTYIKSPSSAQHSGFSAGSYYDVSRVAGMDEHLWSRLFIYNRDNLLRELDVFIENINTYREALASNDGNRLSELIKEGRLLKERDLKQNGTEMPHKFG